MDSSSSILKQRKLPSSSSKRRSCYHNNNNIGGTANTNMMKKGPMKVVYISNPVRFKVTASEFRSLVQELTGQDSKDVPTHQLQFNVANSSCAITTHQSLQFINKEEEEDKGGVSEEQVHQATTTTTEEDMEEDDPLGLLNDDDVFTPLENLSDLFFLNSGFMS